MTHLNLSECFGPTIQGEGPHAGRIASFLRLAGCNLTCSWCDSAYTWDWGRFPHDHEVHPTSVSAAVDLIEPLPGRLVVTGGEPLLQAPALALVLRELADRPMDVETNGTRPLGDTAQWWDTIICSPKIIRSALQGPRARDLDPGILSDHRTAFKFVVADADDLGDVLTFVHEHRIRDEAVWLMPEGTTAAALTARTPMVMEACTTHGFNFTSRLHVYGWHDVRGH